VIHIVLDRDLAPPPKSGTAPPLFGPCLLWTNGWTDLDATWYGVRPRPWRHCVGWGPSSPQKRGHSSPNFSTDVYCGQTVAHRSNCWALVSKRVSGWSRSNVEIAVSLTTPSSLTCLPLPRIIYVSSLFVCLFVCLWATLHKNFWTDLHKIFREGWQWASEQMIKFWWRSRSQIRIRVTTLVRRTLAEVCTVAVLLVIFAILHLYES